MGSELSTAVQNVNTVKISPQWAISKTFTSDGAEVAKLVYLGSNRDAFERSVSVSFILFCLILCGANKWICGQAFFGYLISLILSAVFRRIAQRSFEGRVKDCHWLVHLGSLVFSGKLLVYGASVLCHRT